MHQISDKILGLLKQAPGFEANAASLRGGEEKKDIDEANTRFALLAALQAVLKELRGETRSQAVAAALTVIGNSQEKFSPKVRLLFLSQFATDAVPIAQS